MAFDWLSNPLLRFGFFLALALLSVQFFFFIFILVRHSARVQRQIRIDEAHARFEDIFSAHKEDRPLKALQTALHLSDKELLISWVRAAEKMPVEARLKFAHRADTEGVFNCLPALVKSRKTSDRSLACEVIGLAGLTAFTDVLEHFLRNAHLSPYACHALTRISAPLGVARAMEALEKQRITNSELIKIMGELSPDELQQCLHDHPHHPGASIVAHLSGRAS